MKALERVLEKIILPRYEKLVEVEVTTGGLSDDYFRITYYYNEPLSKGEKMKIIVETDNLHKMVGDAQIDIFIYFEEYQP